MLNCVIYTVTENGYHYLEDKVAKMKEQLSTVGIELIITGYKKPGYDIPLRRDGVLVITDSPEAVKELSEKGNYVTGFYHLRNKDTVFENVPYAVTEVEELTPRSYEEVYRRLAGIPWDILETQRLYVRESMVEDVDDFYRIYADPSITAYVEALFTDPEQERAYMEDYIHNMYGFYGFGMWTIIEKDGNRIIGRAGLDAREGYELPELGFVIEKAYQGKGYATEVCRAILAYAKEELLFDKVQALVEHDNSVSAHLLSILGFVYQEDVEVRGTEYRLMIKTL